MGRLGELALIALLIWLFFPSLTRLLRTAVGLPRSVRPAANAAPTASPGGPAGPGGGPETLVRCPRCGVYFPRSRGLPTAPGTFFCSEACRVAPSS